MSDSPIKIKLADALVMGEWVARYWNGSFVGWHMVVKPWRANLVLTVSRVASEPIQEFETPAAAPVEVWAGQGEPPYYGPGDYKSARALQEMRKENERLKEIVAGVEALKGEHTKEVQRLHGSHRVQAERATQRIATLEFELAEMIAKLDRALRQLRQYETATAGLSKELADLRVEEATGVRTKEAEIAALQTALRLQTEQTEAVKKHHNLELISWKVENSELRRRFEAAQHQLKETTDTVQLAQKTLEGRNAWVEKLEKTNKNLHTSLHLAGKERDEAVGRLTRHRPLWGKRSYLDLSTVFLPKEYNDWGGCKHAGYGTGVMVQVPSLPGPIDIPPWLVPVFAYARQCGADFVRFAEDSPHVVPPTSVELPTYTREAGK